MARPFAVDWIDQIFQLLSVESLLRFRSISRELKQLIRSPKFIKEHLNLALLMALLVRNGVNHFSLLKPKGCRESIGYGYIQTASHGRVHI